jgi:hypothetical protein
VLYSIVQGSYLLIPKYYFELRILEDEITKDVSLMVVDFAIEDELDESKLLWENQVSDLKHVIGSV